MGGFSKRQLRAMTQRLNAACVRTREEAGVHIPYLEGWHVITEANRIFGFDGWDRVTLKNEEMHLGREKGEWHATFRAQVRVIVRAGPQSIVREGTGTGVGRAVGKAPAIEMGLKAAETDATKRALATFGNRFGLALYDPSLANVDGPIATLASPKDWCLVDEAGSPLGRYKTGPLFCAALRRAIEARASPIHLARLWALNAPEVERLKVQEPELRNRGGTHFAALLERLYRRRLRDMLDGLQPFVAQMAAGDGQEAGPEVVAGAAEGLAAGADADEKGETGGGVGNGAENQTGEAVASGSSGEAPAGSQAGPPVRQSNGEAPRDTLKPARISGGPVIKGAGRVDKSALPMGAPRRVRDKVHLRHVAAHPCLVCGRQPSHAHHLTFTQPRGLGQKVSDEFVVPLCAIHHRELHNVGVEEAWWAGHGIDPVPIAERLWTKRSRHSAGAP